MEAFTAYQKALGLAEKKYDINRLVEGMGIAQSNLSNIGVMKYEAQDYSAAFESFISVLNAHDVIKEKGGVSSLDCGRRWL